MIKEKVINNPKLFGVGAIKYLRESRRCPNSNFKLGPKSHILLKIRSNTIPWA